MDLEFIGCWFIIFPWQNTALKAISFHLSDVLCSQSLCKIQQDVLSEIRDISSFPTMHECAYVLRTLWGSFWMS